MVENIYFKVLQGMKEASWQKAAKQTNCCSEYYLINNGMVCKARMKVFLLVYAGLVLRIKKTY